MGYSGLYAGGVTVATGPLGTSVASVHNILFAINYVRLFLFFVGL